MIIPESFEPYIGPAAGVTTSLLWSFTALFFTAAGRRLGATVVNATRIFIAIGLLGLTHRLISAEQTWIPPATPYQVLLLAGSGLVGLSVGDWALFTAFVRIGPRLSMLVMTTSPIFAALFGWAVLGEALAPLAWVGMLLTMAGVGWVILERPAKQDVTTGGSRAAGILLAFVGAACQAGGLLLSKQGMGHGWLPDDQLMNPQAATLLRMFFAGVFVVPTLAWIAARNRLEHPLRTSTAQPSNRRAGYAFTVCGAVVGPYLGVWLSLVAAKHAPLGVAQTTCSLSPIFIVPWVVLLYREHVSARAVVGAIIAVAGVGLLFVQPSG